MNNWMEKFEKSKDEQREQNLNTKLEMLLDLLDETYKDEDKIKVLERIVKVYEELKIDACNYDDKDYMAKKKELADIRYKLKEQEYKESIESQSWNDFKKEEQMEDEDERE